LIALALPHVPFFLCALLACAAVPGVAESMEPAPTRLAADFFLEFQTMALVSM
jgi:hypothetical protein